MSMGADGAISIYVVNNMPDAVLRTTERQLRALIDTARRGQSVVLRFFSLSDHRRSEWAQDYISQHYHDITALWHGDCDGLIVTGTEPRAKLLIREPFWAELCRLIEWAVEHSSSALWQCLAAHAAVLHLDGIQRRELPQKIFGLFDCAMAMDHPLLLGCPPAWMAPHSRFNSVADGDLVACGYSILSTSPEAGVDMFAKQFPGRSRFIFMQGHLEYDADTLLDEYRRDIARFVAGKRTAYPDLPVSYFDRSTEDRFRDMRRRLLAGDRDYLKASADLHLPHSWEAVATQVYANWIDDLARRKSTYGMQLHPASHVATVCK